MKAFSGPYMIEPCVVQADHGGVGPIEFRRLLSRDEFNSPIDFVDYTIIPPGSAIGFHGHSDNDEVYLIARGTPLMRVESEERRLQPGCVSVVRSGQKHGLTNDTDAEVHIFVVQVRYG